MENKLTLADAIVSANTGLDAIKRAPIVEEDTGMKCIRIQDVNQEKEFYNWGNTLVEERNLEKFQLKSDDILIARTGGSVGSNRYISHDVMAVYNNGLIRIRINTKKHNPKFIYYLLQTDAFKSHIEAIAYSTSAQPNMKIKDFLRFEFIDLGIKSENSIDKILSSLDEKIELNRQTNQTLEEMAQALFKSWFVDFDPVFDNLLAKVDFKLENLASDFPAELLKNAQKRLHALQERALQQSCELHALLAESKNNIHSHFPSEFEFSEQIGWIPKGWETKLLSDFLEVKYGKDHKKLSDGEFPVYGSGGVMRYVEEYLYSGESVLIPRKGTLSNIMYVNRKFWSVDTMFYTIPKISNIAKFSFYHLNRLDFVSMNVGSAVPSMTTKVLNILPIIKPTSTVLKKIDDILAAQFMKIELNEKECQSLIKLRDTLLPKLISGEIDLSNMNARIKEVN